jgi:MFS family permease
MRLQPSAAAVNPQKLNDPSVVKENREDEKKMTITTATDIAPPPVMGGPVDVVVIPPASLAFRRYAVVLLLLIFILNFFDRQVINILAEQIRHDLHLADWQIGMMTGFAFAMCNALFGLPLAYLADRYNRPFLLGGAVAVWSAFTALCGGAQNFGQLIIARLGVGAGEAGCTPLAQSLICDYVPREKRASALSLYHMGVPLGSLLGLAVGGVLADAFGWRNAFLIAGAPGLMFAVLAAATLREPRRAFAERLSATRADRPGFRETLKYLAKKRSFLLVAFGSALKAFLSYGHAPFVAVFFFRAHGPELAVLAEPFHLRAAGFLGISLGLISGIGGTFGIWLGGQIADRAAARDVRAYCIVPAISTVAGLPFTISAFWADSAPLALALLIIPAIIGSLWFGSVHTVETSVVPRHMRASSSAVATLIRNLVGLGLGPLCVGLLSDYFGRSLGLGPALGVRWALTISILMAFPAFALFWAARSRLVEEIES